MSKHYIHQHVIACDLDGTLIPYVDDGYYHHYFFCDPVPIMADRVRKWLSEGHTVMIFTARLAFENINKAHFQRELGKWTTLHFGVELEGTCTKHPFFLEFWDDRAIAVEVNTGKRLSNNSRMED